MLNGRLGAPAVFFHIASILKGAELSHAVAFTVKEDFSEELPQTRTAFTL